MVESAANLFLETLRDLLVEESKFLLSVSGEVERVKTDLKNMHALLMKADRERRDSPTLKLYVSQLRDLAFKAETMMETYAVEVESKKFGKTFKEKLRRYICIISECCSVHHIGRDIEEIISSLAELTQNLEKEIGQESPSDTTHQQHLLRQTYAHEVEHHFVGMEKDIGILVSMVKDQTRSQRVVKIYGMGGLGKTTLARKVYNHGDVQSYARAWVCITQHFQPKAVLGNILKELDSNTTTDNMDVCNLVKGIHNFLLQLQRECLIVIDDIWENDHWDIIKPAFPINCNVLLTTRKENIAIPESQPYKLEFLTEDEGWELLHKIALPHNLGPVETGIQLEAIGREIVLKCGRLPLAISVIGGILCQKREDRLAEWKKVNMKMESYLMHGEGVTEYRRVNQVLDLSYDVLPYYLKPCFLYLACFPEDEDIDTETLYRMWMAEGFISHHDKVRNDSLRDVAERYLTELAMRCMVQVRKFPYSLTSHKFDSCRLHDLMHDLCSSKAEEENIVKRIDMQNDDISPSVGRLAITLDRIIDLSSIKGLQELHLRSFMVLNKDEQSSGTITFQDSTISLDKSQCLRMLMLDGCDFEWDRLPSKVGKLIHLRYFSLVGSYVKELPVFICGLPYLQTLDLRILSHWISIRLPNVIWKMKRLKHLFLPRDIEVIGGGKLRLDGLKELEILHGINGKTCCIADIPKLINLVELDIIVDDMDTDTMTTLAHHMTKKRSRLPHTCVFVEGCDFSSDVLKDLLMSPLLVRLSVKSCKISGSFPEYEEGMCENLLYLELDGCEVRGDVMDNLGKYPMLKLLVLEGKKIGIEEALICPSNSFPQLKSLYFQNLPNLKKWQVEEGALPKLTYLQIHKCINLEKVPDGLRSTSALGQLEIDADSMRE